MDMVIFVMDMVTLVYGYVDSGVWKWAQKVEGIFVFINFLELQPRDFILLLTLHSSSTALSIFQRGGQLQ